MDDQSIWKKEISFRRKPKAKAAPPAPGEEPTSVWKKEISFKRKPAALEAEPVVESAPVVETAHVVVPAPAPVVEPVAPVVEIMTPEPVGAWEVDAAVPPAPEQAPELDVAPEPAPVADAPTFEAPAPYIPVTVTAPVPVPEPEPVVHPPVPAAELPPLPAAKAVPFWKKEISLGGGKKEKPAKQKRVKEPKPAKARKEPKPAKPPRLKREKKAPRVKGEKSKGAKRLVGLKIGASQLAAARVSNNGSAELVQVAREPLSPGVIVGGELRDPDALAIALKDFFAKHKLPKKGVRLGISNNRIGVRTFEVSGVEDEKQLDNAIRFRAQEALPIPIDEAVLDYQVLGETTNEQGELVRRVLLVVAYREQVNRYLEACKKAGVTLTGIDLEAFALLRALQAPQEGAGDDPSAALVAVAIGHERSTFAVSDGRVCEFTRVLEWGGSSLNVALARALDAAPSEVEAIKRALSLSDEVVPEGLTPEQAAKARDALQRATQAFARELVSSLQFYQNQPGSLGIGEIVLTGGTAHLRGLAAELQRLIGVNVRIGDPIARMKVGKKIGDLEQLGSLAVAIGLGIED